MNWYVLAIRAQRYPSIEEKLTGLEVELYYPRRTVWRKQRSGPRKRKDYPLIPSYLFAGVDLKRVSARSILSIDGVHNFLGINGEPSLCDLTKLDAIRASERRGDYDETLRRIEQMLVGQSMTIERGAFATYTGVVTSIDGEHVELEIPMLGRTATIKISVDNLSKPI